jgi:hypothetical protein
VRSAWSTSNTSACGPWIASAGLNLAKSAKLAESLI